MMAASSDQLLFRRMIVSFQGAPDSPKSLELVASFARIFGSDLSGVFTEDAGLVEWVASPWARHVSRDSAISSQPSPEKLSQDFSAAAEIARKRLMEVGAAHGVSTSFQVVRTNMPSLEPGILSHDDLLAVIEPADPLARMCYPFVSVQQMVATSSAPVLYVPHSSVARQGPILLVMQDQDEASQETARRISQILGQELVLLSNLETSPSAKAFADESLILLNRKSLSGGASAFSAHLSARGVPALILGAPNSKDTSHHPTEHKSS